MGTKRYSIWCGNRLIEDLTLECSDEAMQTRIATEVIALAIRDAKPQPEPALRVRILVKEIG